MTTFLMIHNRDALAYEVAAIAALVESIGRIEANEWDAARLDWQATR